MRFDRGGEDHRVVGEAHPGDEAGDVNNLTRLHTWSGDRLSETGRNAPGNAPYPPAKRSILPARVASRSERPPQSWVESTMSTRL